MRNQELEARKFFWETRFFYCNFLIWKCFVKEEINFFDTLRDKKGFWVLPILQRARAHAQDA